MGKSVLVLLISFMVTGAGAAETTKTLAAVCKDTSNWGSKAWDEAAYVIQFNRSKKKVVNNMITFDKYEFKYYVKAFATQRKGIMLDRYSRNGMGKRCGKAIIGQANQANSVSCTIKGYKITFSDGVLEDDATINGKDVIYCKKLTTKTPAKYKRIGFTNNF